MHNLELNSRGPCLKLLPSYYTCPKDERAEAWELSQKLMFFLIAHPPPHPNKVTLISPTNFPFIYSSIAFLNLALSRLFSKLQALTKIY